MLLKNNKHDHHRILIGFLASRRQVVHETGSSRLDIASTLVGRFTEAMKSVDELESSLNDREKEMVLAAERAHAAWDNALTQWSNAHAVAVSRVDAAAKQLAAEGEPRLHVRRIHDAHFQFAPTHSIFFFPPNHLQLAERLRGLERDLKRTEEAREVLEKIRLLNEGKEAYRLQDEVQARRAAQLLKTIMRVTEDLSNDRFQKAKEGTKILYGATEKRLLELFDEALNEEDTARMAQLAVVLNNFQGGLSCSRLYISRLSFFFDEVILRKDADAAQQCVKECVDIY